MSTRIPKYIRRRAAKMRRYATPSEIIMRQALIYLELEHREQFCVTAKNHWFILDFFVPKYALGIEVDGANHGTIRGKIYDSYRTQCLNDIGIRIIRFSNDYMYNRLVAIHLLKQALTPVHNAQDDTAYGSSAPSPVSGYSLAGSHRL